MTNAMEILKASATTGMVHSSDPVEIFLNKIDIQIGYAADLKEGKVIKQRSLWFRKDATGYVVRVGRNAFEIAGSKLFRATDLDHVVQILSAAKDFIAQDEKTRAVIAKHSTTRSERLKVGRAKKNAEKK